MVSSRIIEIACAVLLAAAVALGAVGAHTLQGTINEYRQSVFERALFYHFIHALGALLIVALARTNRVAMFSAGLLLVGLMLFSGSLYLIAFTNEMGWRRITPMGGMSFIIGWLLFALVRAFQWGE